MALGRNEITIDYGGTRETTLELIPFNWPRNFWEMLLLVASEETGWRDLDDTAVANLRTLFNGAHGSVERGLKGNIVQYVEGTGRTPFVVVDWRGNSGLFVFVPDSGLDLEEIHGAAASLAGTGYFTARMQFVLLAVGIHPSSGIPSAEAFGTAKLNRTINGAGNIASGYASGSHTVTGGA